MASGEDDLIAKYFKPLVTAPGALGLTDDAAFYTPPEGYDLVLTTDVVVAGVHFPADEMGDQIACKALRVNLSDLAAKGARPAGFLMTLALTDDYAASESWMGGFASGLAGDIRFYSCPLLGGDTVRTHGPVSISIFAFGLVPHGTMVKRRGARPGDRIFVSGTIGDAAIGLKIATEDFRARGWRLVDEDRVGLLARYNRPQPRLDLADALRACASAAMDVSDGLVGDLGKLCAASGVSAQIEVTRVPIFDAVRRVVLPNDPSALELVLTGGDDYEILCAIPPTRVGLFREQADLAKVPVTEIGEIVEGEAPPQVIGPDGAALTFTRGSFSHFR